MWDENWPLRRRFRCSHDLDKFFWCRGGEEGGAGGLVLEDFAKCAYDCEIVGGRGLGCGDHKHQLHGLVAVLKRHTRVAAAHGEDELLDVLGASVGKGDLVAEAGSVEAVACEQLGIKSVEVGYIRVAGEE